MDAFASLKVLTLLVLPPGSMAVGLMAGAALAAFGFRRLGVVVALLAVAETLILSLPRVTDALFLPLEKEALAAATHAPVCCYDAIVVLGGGVTPAAPPMAMEPDLGEGADRIWHGARLYRRGVAPRIVVSGGNFVAQMRGRGTTEVDAMRQFLLDLGVPSEAILLEGNSLNTIENIRNVRGMVGEARVALVTSAYHMPRALRLARSGKLNVGAFPTDWRPPAETRAPWDSWIPASTAMLWSSMALREHLALLFDRRDVH